MNDYAKRPRTELVRILLQLAGHYGKRYCWPSQAKLLKLYQTHTGQAMSERSLNRHLGTLEAEGWIKRTRRHRVEPGRGMTFHSTLYSFGRRATRAAASMVASLAIWAVATAESPANSPSAENARISVHPVQSYSRPPPSGWPGEPQKVALEHLQRARELLSR